MLLFLLLIGSLSSSAQRNWTSKRDKNGIEVFVKDAPGSKLKAYKAISKTTASIEECANLLLDFTSHVKWSYTVIQSDPLADSEDGNPRAYMVMDAPWPVDDRDIVIEGAKEKLGENKILVTLTALSGVKEEVKGMVRVTLSTTTWLFERKDGTTFITYEGLSDPGGNIPEWLINALLVDVPYETIRDFVTLVEK